MSAAYKKDAIAGVLTNKGQAESKGHLRSYHANVVLVTVLLLFPQIGSAVGDKVNHLGAVEPGHLTHCTVASTTRRQDLYPI